MEQLTLRFKLEPDELAAASYDHSPAAKASAARTRALGAAGFVAGLAFLLATPAGLALVALGALIFGLGTRFSIIRRQRWVMERTPALTDPVTAVADGDGVRFTTAHSDLWYRWSNYRDAQDTGSGVALVLRGGTAVRWIPARAFATVEQRATWAAMAREGIARSDDRR